MEVGEVGFEEVVGVEGVPAGDLEEDGADEGGDGEEHGNEDAGDAACFAHVGGIEVGGIEVEVVGEEVEVEVVVEVGRSR